MITPFRAVTRRSIYSRVVGAVLGGFVVTTVASQSFEMRTWTEFGFRNVNGLAHRIRAEDINRDGFLDLVHSRPGIRVNRGDVSFADMTLPTPPTVPFLMTAGGVAVGDLDKDGRVDIVAPQWRLSGFHANPHILYLGDPAGGFAADLSGRLPILFSNAIGAEVADIDNDGDVDILIYNEDTVDYLLVNDGSGRFTDETTSRLPTALLGDATRAMLFVDVNNDGYVDIVRGGWGGAAFALINDGFGGFTTAGQPFGAPYCRDIQAADIDRDGHLDLWFSNDSGDTLWLGDGNGRFVDATHRLAGLQPPPYGFASRTVAFADFDADGDLDVIVGTRTPSGPTTFVGPVLLENDGAGRFRNVTLSALHGIQATCNAFAVADFDRDGDLDVALVFEAVPFEFATQSILFNMKRHIRVLPTSVRNATTTIELYADSNHILAPLLAVAPARIPLGGLGIVGIDPTAFVELPRVYFPSRGRQDLLLPIPNNPTLVGRTLHFQAVDLWSESSGPGARLTNVTRTTIR